MKEEVIHDLRERVRELGSSIRSDSDFRKGLLEMFKIEGLEAPKLEGRSTLKTVEIGEQKPKSVNT